MNLDGVHTPGPDAWWSEAWHLDAARADGTGLTVRLELYPNRDTAWFWAYLVLPDLPGPVVVRDHEVPLPRQGLEIRSEGLWAELWCETPMEHWTYGLEAFAIRLDDPADALGDDDEIGERIPIGLDLEWEESASAHERGAHWPVAGIVQPGVVHGEVLLGRSRFELDCDGERRHTWGRRDWFGEPGWTCGFRAGDQTVHVAARGDAVDGFVWDDDPAPEPISSARIETRRRADGLPVAARAVVDEEIEVEIEVLGAAPVRIDRRATLARAVCRFAVDGAEGVGWATWLE